jgi:hypothetical protein
VAVLRSIEVICTGPICRHTIVIKREDVSKLRRAHMGREERGIKQLSSLIVFICIESC